MKKCAKKARRDGGRRAPVPEPGRTLVRTTKNRYEPLFGWIVTQRPNVGKRARKPALAAHAPGRGPLYRQLLGSINTRIRKGDWGDTGRLPSERDLSEQFGVSRSTVRQALEQLSHAGLLKKI